MYKQIVGATFNGIFEKKYQLLKALLIPFFIIVLFEQVLPYSVLAQNKIILFTSAIVLFCINILIAITTHRVLLIEKNAVPTWGLYKFTSREIKFFFYSLLIVLFVMIIILPVVLLFSVILDSSNELVYPLMIISSGIISIFVFSRLSLVLPSIALDHDLSFTDSWKLTSKHKILCMFTIIIIPSLIAILISLVYGIAIEFLTAVISTKLNFLNSLLTLFVNVFIISALSATYKFLVPDNYSEKEEVFVEQSREIKTSSKDDTFDIFLPFSLGLDFDEIKELLYEEYSRFGFDNVVINKDNSWMIKTTREGQSYVSVSVLEDSFKIESFNTQKPDIEIFKNKDEKL